MTDNSSKLNLDEDARRRLAQCYALLIRLASDEATDPETLDGEPGSVASTDAKHRCGQEFTTSAVVEQAGAKDE